MSNVPSIAGIFAPRTVDMLSSPALRALSLSGRRVLDRLEIELGHEKGCENGNLVITFDDFVAFGMDRHSIAPGIRECEALGFVEITEHGRAGNAEFRAPNRFRLTYRNGNTTDPADPKGNRMPPTNEWLRIATLADAKRLAQASRKTPKQKTKANGGKRTVSVGGGNTEITKAPVGKIPTIPAGKKPTSLYISAPCPGEPEIPEFLRRVKS